MSGKMERAEKRIKDEDILVLIELARDILNEIKKIAKERSKGVENPLGFLGYVVLFTNFVQTFALQQTGDMAQQLLAQIEKMKQKGVSYVA